RGGHAPAGAPPAPGAPAARAGPAAPAPAADLPETPAASAIDLAAAAVAQATTPGPAAKTARAAAAAAPPASTPVSDTVEAALAALAPPTGTIPPPPAAAQAAQAAARQVIAPEIASISGKIVKAVEEKAPAAAATNTVAGALQDAVEATLAEAVQSAHAATTGQGDADTGKDKSGAQGAALAEAAPAAAPDASAPTFVAPGTTAAPAPAPIAATLAKAAVTPETVSHLTTEITGKAQLGKTSRFDVVLQPEGLGRVDVRIEIAKDGKLTAALNFDNPQAAADMRGKSGELRQALAQAGFIVADTALSFDTSSQNGGQNQNAFFNFQGGENGRQAFNGRAFQSALGEDLPTISPSALLPGLRVAERSGVDVKI
ncbi:MAG: flagellar hook-length control protein FliK, partial [Gemmatimonadaceae bacterium]|nr:flagellar hook-length control protein FliK [Caulobacter sp.]